MRERERVRFERRRLMSSAGAIRRTGSLLDLFMARVVPVTESGCWLWIGQSHSGGYGVLGKGKGREYAHRISYRIFKGMIPKGLTIDHLCRVRCCVNPEHLEAVTSRENTLRGESISALHKRKSHCKYGHELVSDNLLMVSSRPSARICKICKRERDFKYYSKVRLSR